MIRKTCCQLPGDVAATSVTFYPGRRRCKQWTGERRKQECEYRGQGTTCLVNVSLTAGEACCGWNTHCLGIDGRSEGVGAHTAGDPAAFRLWL